MADDSTKINLMNDSWIKFFAETNLSLKNNGFVTRKMDFIKPTELQTSYKWQLSISCTLLIERYFLLEYCTFKVSLNSKLCLFINFHYYYYYYYYIQGYKFVSVHIAFPYRWIHICMQFWYTYIVHVQWYKIVTNTLIFQITNGHCSLFKQAIFTWLEALVNSMLENF